VPEAGQRQALTFGEIVLLNGDGYFDTMVQNYSIDGRPVIVRAGAPSFAYASFETLFNGTASGWRLSDDNTVRVALRDLAYRLEVPLQPALYGGTGGLDGTVQLTGKPKPLAYGDLRGANVAGVLVDPTKLIYQWHDGPLADITNVYDSGLPLAYAGDVADITGISPDPSTWISQRSGGYVRLGSTPAGVVTADLVGDNSAGLALAASDVALRILTTRTPLGPADIDGASFAALKGKQPGNVGYWFGLDQITVGQALDVVLGGINAWWGCGRLGGIQVGRVDAPDMNSVVIFTEVDVLTLQRVDPPDSVNPPNWRRRVGYAPNFTVQTTDLAGAVSADRRQFLSQAYRVASASRDQTRYDYLQATDPDPLANAFVSLDDANAEAGRLLNLWGVKRALYWMTTKLKAYRLAIGSTVTLQYSRYGLNAGLPAVIVGTRLDADRNESSLLLLV
jgi:hypothetical protein